LKENPFLTGFYSVKQQDPKAPNPGLLSQGASDLKAGHPMVLPIHQGGHFEIQFTQ
jgi:hypothetical protein